MIKPPRKIAVIGAGTMGLGITQQAAVRGFDVGLTTYHRATFERTRDKLERFFARSVERGKLSAEQRDEVLARIQLVETVAEATAGAGLVIESVVENLEIKLGLFRKLSREAPAEAFLATDTSSLPVADLAAVVTRPDRVVGMHFFNPVHAMKLVEVVRAPKTSPEACELALATARELGKDPIVVQDTPGFASSRLGVVLGLEAMRMVEQGVASVEDIDKALELGYRHPMGPLKLTDLIGLDVRMDIARALERELSAPQYRPPQILRDKVARGELGKKSGQGFYRWDPESGDILL